MLKHATVVWLVAAIALTLSVLLPSGQPLLTVAANPGTPPAVITNAADNATTSSATLRGDLTSLGTAATVSVYFEYGTTTSYGSTTTVESMTGTGTFSANVTGLIPSVTYHFRAKANGGAHGTANGTDMTFTTAVIPPIVVTTNASGITNRSATISGNLTSLGTASTVNISLEYGTTTGYGTTTAIQSMTGTGVFTANIIQLTENTTYHFRAKAVGGVHGTATGNDVSFTTLTPPTVTAGAATSITTNSAILSGSLTSLGTATAIIVSFEYGPTTDYGSSTIAEAMTGTGAFSVSLTGLAPGATYHFRARADGGENGIATSADMFFTTLASLAVNTVGYADKKITSVTLNGNLISLGAAPTVNVYFEYGTTIAYGSTTPLQLKTSPGAFNANLTGLSEGTTYHFRAKVDGGAYGTANGTDITFKTLTPLAISTVSATDIGVTSATITGDLLSLDEAAIVNVYFEYGLTTSYGITTPTQARTSQGAFSATLTGLEPGITYHFRARADAGAYGTVTGANFAFTTVMPIPPVVVTRLAEDVGASQATLTCIFSAFGSAPSLITFFEYGEHTTYGSRAVASVTSRVDNATGATIYEAKATGLSPQTTYHFRAVADGGEHGMSVGADRTFTTLTPFSPMVRSSAATGITSGGATLNGNLISLGQAATANVSFEYGLTTSYGSTTALVPKNATGLFSANITGLTPGTTYHFRAKVDGGAYGVNSGADTTFTTLPPVPPLVMTLASANITITSQNVTGNLTSLGTATSVNVYFEYGKTMAYGSETSRVPVIATGPFNIIISGLIPGTTYHFRAKADAGEQGKATGADMAFTTLTPIPPVVTTSAVNSIAVNSANVSGNLTSLGSATTANVSFEYGTTTSYVSTTAPVSVNTIGPFSANITGLNGGTTYYFRAKADAGLYGRASGASSNFTTAVISPTVTTSPSPTDFAATWANVSGNLTSLGTATAVNVYFKYGMTIGYGSMTPPISLNATGPFSANITSLSSNTTYHFMAMVNGGVHGTANGTDQTFTTQAGGAPEVVTLPATAVTSTTATVSGNLTSLGAATTANVSFDYGTTIGYGSATAFQSMNATGVFNATLGGLSSNTTYHFRAKVDGGVYGADMPFLTLALPVVGGGIGGGGGGGGDRAYIIAQAEVSGFLGNGPIVDGPNRITLNTVKLTTIDGNASLDIPAGTTLKMPDEKAVTSFSAAPAAPPAAPPQGAIVFNYNFGPDGASFSPPLTLTYDYGDDQVPTGADEADLYIAFWNGSLWVKLDSTVDTQANTVKAGVSHFTNFALIASLPITTPPPSPPPYIPPVLPPAPLPTLPPAPPETVPAPTPADFTISRLLVTPNKINVGVNVAIAAVVTNKGGTAGTHVVVMMINGVEEGRKEVILDAGASQTITFVVTKQTPGAYQVDLNGLVSSFTVQAKAAVTPWLVELAAVLVMLIGLAAYLLVIRRKKGRAKRQAEPAVAAEAKQTAEEAKEKARQQTEIASLTEGAEPAATGEFYRGHVTLTIMPPIDFSQLWELQECLRQAENLSVVRTGGSIDEGTVVVVSMEQPLLLIDILRVMPPIERVLKKNNKILVILKPRSAG